MNEPQRTQGCIFFRYRNDIYNINKRTSQHYLQTVCETSHEWKTHHKNWSRRTLDPLLALATSWLGYREQDKSYMCPLPTSHQDTNREFQMELYLLLLGTKTKIFVFVWLKSPKEEKSWYMILTSWLLSVFTQGLISAPKRLTATPFLHLWAGVGLSVGLEFLHAGLQILFFWSATRLAYLTLTLQSSDVQELHNTCRLDFGHD